MMMIMIDPNSESSQVYFSTLSVMDGGNTLLEMEKSSIFDGPVYLLKHWYEVYLHSLNESTI